VPSLHPVVAVELPGVAPGRVGAGLLAVRAGDLAAGRVRATGRRGGGEAPAADRHGLLTLAEHARPAGQGDTVVVFPRCWSGR
jgi:hypothetical protein